MSVLPSDDRFVVPSSVDGRFVKPTIKNKLSQSSITERTATRLKLSEVSVSVALAAVSTSTEEELFSSICDIISHSGEFDLCWIGVADNESGVVKKVASAGKDDGYVDAIHINYLSGPRSKGPAGRAIRDQTTVISNDIATDILMALSRDHALASGFKSLIALPLLVDSDRRGALLLYSTKVNAFSPVQVNLLERLGKIVGVAWEAIVSRRIYAESQERKRSQDQLLDRAIAKSPLAFAVLDELGMILTANQALCDLLGRSQKELIGFRGFDFIDAGQREDAAETFSNSPYSNDAVVTERLVVRKDGSKRWVRIHTSHVREFGPPQALLQIEDIHDRKLALDTLAEYSTKLKNVLADAPISLFSVNRSGNVTLAAGGLRKFQKDFEVLQIEEGRNLRLLPGAEDGKCQLLPLVNQNEPYEGNIRVGSAYIEVHLNHESNENDTEGEIIGVAIDVTESHRAKDRLRQKAEYAQILIGLSQQFMLTADSDCAIYSALSCIRNLDGCTRTLFVAIQEGGNSLAGQYEIEPGSVISVQLFPRQNQLIGICLDEVSITTIDDLESGRGVDIGGVKSLDKIVIIPLVGRDSILGALVILVTDHETLTDELNELFSSLMSNLNATIQRTELEKAHILEARRDRMTQLLNRDSFREELKDAIADLETKTGKKLLVATLDIDRFKQINESLGHEVGDRVVATIAQRLKDHCQPNITIARTGGDEFGMFTTVDTSLSKIELEQILQAALATVTDPIYLVNIQLSVTASIGATVVLPNCGHDIVTVLSRIDIAMYDAKESQNRIKFYEKKSTEPTAENLILLANLTRAIEQDEIEVFLQPKMSARYNRLTGFEALARWRHLTKGFIPPDKFVKMAEQTGQIRALTETVLKKTVLLLQQLGKLGYCLPIAINLSPSLFADETIADTIENVLDAAAIDHSLIELEFTETMSLADPDNASRVFDRLAASGFRFSIDDFGTGFSSLNHLRNVAASSIKIDKSYIEKMTSCEKDYAIVQGVIDLSHALGYTVVAEGVEDKITLDALKAIGCDEIQGYLLAKPMPIEDVINWLAGHTQKSCYSIEVSADTLL